MNYNPKDELVVTAPVHIERGRIADLVSCALDGGSTYWLSAVKLWIPEEWPEDCEYMSDVVASGLARWVFFDTEDPINVRHPENLCPSALYLMAKNHPKHFQDFLDENEDADTGDIFFQLMCFGEVVYG